MTRSTATVISLLILGAGLILADIYLSWDWYWRLALVVIVALLPFALVQQVPAPAGANPTTPCTPAPAGTSMIETVIVWSIMTILVSLAIYAVLGVISSVLVYWNGNYERLLARETKVVETGFPRHDAPTPPTYSIPPFRKTLKAGKVYDVFPMKAGEVFKVHQMNAPIQVKVTTPEPRSFDGITRPGYRQAKTTGMLQVLSATDNNLVQITFGK